MIPGGGRKREKKGKGSKKRGEEEEQRRKKRMEGRDEVPSLTSPKFLGHPGRKGLIGAIWPRKIIRG
jgi:hypothetical protein